MNTCKMFFRPIRIDTFPEHFQNMSRDENRGFSEEYEVSLSKNVQTHSFVQFQTLHRF